MLFHLSIDADDPRHVAHVIAEIWGGVAAPFPGVIDGSWMALACDDRGTMIEVYPRGTEMHQGEGADQAFGVAGGTRARTPTHCAIATALDVNAVKAIAAREGWPVKYCLRGGRFGVMELWMEGWQMIEVLTPAMQAEYLDTMRAATSSDLIRQAA